VVDRECTRHDGSSIRKLCKCSEINPSLPDLHHRFLALVLVTLGGTLPRIWFLGPRTITDKMIRTPAIEIVIIAVSLLHLLNIWPRARLLRLLQRNRRSVPSLLLGRPENQSTSWGISLRCSGRCVRNNPVPRWLSTRGSSRVLPLFLSMMCHDAIFLS
jgi:hypothetical protein